MLRRVLPVLAVATWVAALAALIIVLATEAAGPRLLSVEGAAGWRQAQAFRLTCAFAQGVQIAVEDAAWTLCFDAEGRPELVRFAFAEDRIERRWPLPEGLRPRLWPTPGADVPADERPWLAIEAATHGVTGELALIVSRWRGDDEAVALVAAAPEGGLRQVASLDVAPLLVRGLAPLVDGGFEIVLADGRLLGVSPAGRVEARALPDFPADRPMASVEWARRGADVWRFLYSVETRAAQPGVPGEREVRAADPTSDQLTQPRLGTLRTTDTWPFGDFLALHDGGAINAALPASRRFDGVALRPLAPPDGVAEGSPLWVSTMRQLLLLRAAELTWMPVWQRLGVAGAAAVALPGRWLVVAGDGVGGLAVGGRPDAVSPVAVRGWQPFAPLVAPASKGGWWLADGHGRYVRLAREGRTWRRADPMDASERVERAVQGRLHQATSFSSGGDAAPDGLPPGAELRALGRRLALPVVLAAPPLWALLFVALRRMKPAARRGRWLAGPTRLLQLGAGLYLAAAGALVGSFVSVLSVL